MKYRSLFWKIFFCFWLAAAAMIAALNVMLWLSFASDPNPERRRGALGEALNLYAESAVQVYDSEGQQSFEEYVSTAPCRKQGRRSRCLTRTAMRW